MPDRIIRDELLESGRWLDLPTDTARICYVGLLLRCDDFGNIEGGPRRLFRFFYGFAQVKTPADADAVILQLADADLIRRYEFEGREFFHIPRFRPHRQYLVRKCPLSPWDGERPLGKTRRIINQGLAKSLADISQSDDYHMAEGVGVGVVRTTKNELPPVDNSMPVDNLATAKTWTDYWTSKGKAFGIEAKAGESKGDYCRRIQAFAKAKT